MIWIGEREVEMPQARMPMKLTQHMLTQEGTTCNHKQLVLRSFVVLLVYMIIPLHTSTGTAYRLDHRHDNLSHPPVQANSFHSGHFRVSKRETRDCRWNCPITCSHTVKPATHTSYPCPDPQSFPSEAGQTY